MFLGCLTVVVSRKPNLRPMICRLRREDTILLHYMVTTLYNELRVFIHFNKFINKKDITKRIGEAITHCLRPTGQLKVSVTPSVLTHAWIDMYIAVIEFS